MGIPAEEVETGAMTETMTPVPAGCVVVGVDGSPGAEAALDWAIEHARLTRRTLALVHGWDTVPSVWLDQVGADAVTLQAEIRAAAAEVVAAAEAACAEVWRDAHTGTGAFDGRSEAWLGRLRALVEA